MVLFAVPYEEYDQKLLLIQAFIQIFVILLMIAVDIHILKKRIEKRALELKYIENFIRYFWVGLLLGTIPMFLCLYARDIDWIYGIPLWDGRHLWWTNFSYLIISIGSIYLFLFMMAIFQKPPKKIFIIYLILTIIFNIWSLYHGIYVYQPGTSSLTLPMSLLYLFISFFLWGFLFKISRMDFKKVEKSIFKVGMYLINLSSLFMIIGLIMYVLNTFIPGIGILTWAFNFITVFLIYLGYVLPEWFRNIAIKKFNLDE